LNKEVDRTVCVFISWIIHSLVNMFQRVYDDSPEVDQTENQTEDKKQDSQVILH